MPRVRVSGDRDDADGLLSVRVRLQTLRYSAEAEAGPLLRVLFLWLRPLPAGSGGTRHGALERLEFLEGGEDVDGGGFGDGATLPG